MKKWWIVGLVAAIAAFWVVITQVVDSSALADTDTQAAVRSLAQNTDVFEYFKGDWPLGNHFYRPVSTLAFQADYALHPTSAKGWLFTNALLAGLCVLLLAWFVAELTAEPWAAAGSAVLLASWMVPRSIDLSPLLPVLVVLVLVGVGWSWLRERKLPPFGQRGGPWRRYGTPILGFFAVCLAARLLGELNEVQPLNFRIVSWIPGRTASVMTVFALIAGAAYCRFERLGAPRDSAPAPSPLDPPGRTRGEAVVVREPKGVWVWFGLAAVSTALALGSYEQAVMLPGILVGCGVLLRYQGIRPRWKLLAVFFALLGAYLWVRHAVLPSGVSAYQKQQTRTGIAGPIMSLLDYALPAGRDGYFVAKQFELGPEILLDPRMWAKILGVVACLVAFVVGWRQKVLVRGGLILSTLAFLPMAFFNQFEHYHLWPRCFRAMLVLGLGKLVWDLLVTVCSPRAWQSPPRPDPEPGLPLRP